METDQPRTRRSVIPFAVANASLGVFLYYYLLSSFNSIQTILDEFIFPDISNLQMCMVAASPFLGAMIGAYSTDYLGKKVGRRHAMILTNAIAMIGVLFTMFDTLELFTLGRVLTGIEGGVAIVLVNTYTTEISEDPLRGQLGVIPNISAGFGILMAFLLGELMPYFIDHGVPDVGYRVILALPALVSMVIMLNLIFYFNLETPFYLVAQKREQEAKEILKQLYDEEHSARLKKIILERDYVLQEEGVTLKDLLRPKYRRAFAVSILLSISPYFMGKGLPIIFSNIIFTDGFSDDADYSLSLIFTSLIGALSFIFGLISLPFMLSYSRRVFAIVGSGLLFAINLALTLVAFFGSIQGLSIKILTIAWIVAFTLTLGSLEYLYPGETLPESGVSITAGTGSLAGFLITLFYLPVSDVIGYEGVYLFFTVCSLIVFGLFSYYMIDTKARSKVDMLKLYGKSDNEERESLLNKAQ